MAMLGASDLNGKSPKLVRLTHTNPLPHPETEQNRQKIENWALQKLAGDGRFLSLCMKAETHPNYNDAEIRCACSNVIQTRSTRKSVLIGICNVCHPFYTGMQKFVDTAGRVDKFQQRMAKTQAAQAASAAAAAKTKKK